MGKCYHFIRSGKDHIVVADNRSAAHRADSEFFFASFFSPLGTVKNIFIPVIHRLIDSICKRKCRSRWSIQFLVMMFLYDLHIKSFCCQHLSCFLHKAHQSIDSQ